MHDHNPPSDEENLRYTLLISAVATIGGFLFGFDSGVINGTVTGLQVAFQSDSATTGFSVASMLLGSAVGAFFAGRFADQFGRRAMMIVTAVLFVVSAVGSGVAGSATAFVVYRVLGGLAVGGASVMAPAYICEVVPARLRGALATIQQIAIIAGLFIAFVSNYLLAEIAGSATSIFWLGFETWRWMFWVEVVPATAFLLLLFLIPESPRFLVARGQIDAATTVLSRLFGPSSARTKIAQIKSSLADDHAPRMSDVMTNGTLKLRPIVWVGIGLAVFQQLVGINVVFYYGAVLWQSVGFTENDALLINVISGALSIIAVLVTLSLIDRIGRKPFLLVGSVGMAATLAAMVLAFSAAQVDDSGQLTLSDSMGRLALIAGNAYVFFFNLSWGPVMWVLLGEMFPNQIRGLGLAISGLAQWLANFAITMTFPLLLVSIGLAGTYGIYCFFAVVSLAFVIFAVRETRGLELEDMQG